MKHRKRRGQAIVELALVFPFFLLVIVGGIFDFGLAFYNHITLQGIANTTSAWAAESGGFQGVLDPGQIHQKAISLKPTWWSGVFRVESETVLIPTGATMIRVTLTYESPTYTPFYQTMLGAATGHEHLNLRTMAAYQIPKVVARR